MGFRVEEKPAQWTSTRTESIYGKLFPMASRRPPSIINSPFRLTFVSAMAGLDPKIGRGELRKESSMSANRLRSMRLWDCIIYVRIPSLPVVTLGTYLSVQGASLPLTARQTHTENRFRFVRPCLNCSPMAAHNFARDIESEPKAAAIIVSARPLRAALKRFKDLT